MPLPVLEGKGTQAFRPEDMVRSSGHSHYKRDEKVKSYTVDRGMKARSKNEWENNSSGFQYRSTWHFRKRGACLAGASLMGKLALTPALNISRTFVAELLINSG